MKKLCIPICKLLGQNVSSLVLWQIALCPCSSPSLLVQIVHCRFLSPILKFGREISTYDWDYFDIFGVCYIDQWEVGISFYATCPFEEILQRVAKYYMISWLSKIVSLASNFWFRVGLVPIFLMLQWVLRASNHFDEGQWPQYCYTIFTFFKM